MTKSFFQKTDAPNGMQMIELYETPKNEMQPKEILISDGGMNRPTLTLAPMGMVAPRRCQELQISGRVGSAFVHWAMESIILTNQHKTLDSFID